MPQGKTNGATKLAILDAMDQVLSLSLLEKATALRDTETASAAIPAEEIEALVAARTQAKKDRNFAEADRIRDQLKEMGITLVDTKEGTTWHL